MLSNLDRGGSRARRTAMVLAAGAMASLASVASGQTWIGPASGNWNVAANWSPTGVPTSGTTTSLSFTGSGAAITATNDIGVFVLNILNNFTNTSGFTIPATNSLTLDGTTPTINHNGRGLFTIASNMLLNANTTINGSGPGNIALNGVLSGPGGLTISTTPATAFNGYVILGGTNTLGGGVTLNGGNLRISGAGNLGTGSFTVGASGGVVDVSTSHTPTTTSFNINGATRITGSALTISSTNNLTGSGPLTLNTTSAMVVQNASTYSGTVSVERAINPSVSGNMSGITLSGANGAMTSVPTWNIRAGGTLTLTNATGAINSNRIGDSAAINLGSGLIAITTNATNINEDVGNITGSGYNVVSMTVSAGTLPLQISADSLARADRGTFLIRGSNLGTGGSISGGNAYLTLGAAPTLVGGGGADDSNTISIVPWAIGDTSSGGSGTSLVTYNATTGFRPLAVAEYAANLTSGATTNARLTAATANAGSATINALAMVGGGSVTGAGSLTVSSGAIFNNGATGAIANSITFPSGVEGVIFTNTAMGISGNMTGDNGVTISSSTAAGSATTLTLSGDNTGLTGTLTLNAGTLSFANLNNLPGTGQIVTSGRGSASTALLYSASSPITIGRDIAVNNGWLSLRTSSTLGGDVTYSGVISGDGAIYAGNSSAASRIILGPSNTYTGPTRIDEGQVVISGDGSLGNGGGLDFFCGASAMGTTTIEGVAMTGNWTTSRPISFASIGGGVDTGAFAATWNGQVVGSAGLTKVGTGELRINGNNAFSGGVTLGLTSPALPGGDFRLANDGGLMTTAYTANANSRIILDSTTLPTGTPSGAVTIDRVVNNATVTLNSGGNLTMTGHATQDVNEVVGTLALTGSGNIVQVNTSGAALTTLTFSTFTPGSGTVNFRADDLGNTCRIIFSSFSTFQILGGQLATNLSTLMTDDAVYDPTLLGGFPIGVRLINPVTDFTNGIAIQNGAPTNLPTTANFRVNPALIPGPIPVFDPANTINALRFAPGGVVDYNAGVASVLTITAGSLFTEPGAAASITQSGAGGLTLTSGAANLAITTNADLTNAATLGGTGGITKTGAGVLTQNAPITNTGTIAVSAGTINLNAASAPASSWVVNANLNLGAAFAATNLTGTTGAISMGANPMTLTGTTSNYSGTLAGAGQLNYNPTAVARLTLGGNNAGYSGNIVGNANARLAITNPNALGTGSVDVSAQTASSTFSTPTLGFDFGPNAVETVGNDIAFSNTAAINVYLTPLNSTTNVSGSVTLSGLISGGNVAGTTKLWWEESGTTQAYVLRLTNPANTFRGILRVNYGTLGVVSDAALGNVANPIELNSNAAGTNGSLRFDANNIVLAGTRGVSMTSSTSSGVNTNGNNGEIAGVVSGAATMVKMGAGTLKFSNSANTHTGVVNVNAGTLQVDGNIALSATNPVNVKTGGTLSGVGTILRTVNVEAGGILSPGASPGILDVNGVAMVANSTLFIEIDGNIAGDGAGRHDQLNVAGTVALGDATLDLDSLGNYAPAITDLLFIIANDAADAVTGTFVGLPEGAIVTWDTTWSANISYLGDTATGTIGNGNDVVLYNVVPAPGAGVLFGLAGVFASRRRRR